MRVGATILLACGAGVHQLHSPPPARAFISAQLGPGDGEEEQQQQQQTAGEGDEKPALGGALDYAANHPELFALISPERFGERLS